MMYSYLIFLKNKKKRVKKKKLKKKIRKKIKLVKNIKILILMNFFQKELKKFQVKIILKFLNQRKFIYNQYNQSNILKRNINGQIFMSFAKY